MEYWSIGVLEHWVTERRQFRSYHPEKPTKDEEADEDTPPLHHSTTPPLHHSTTPPLHHSTTPPLHHSVTPLLFHRLASLLPVSVEVE